MRGVAVIGLGNIATRHRHNLKLLFPDVKIYSLSSSGRKISEAINDCDEVVTEISSLFNRIDMVIIASPATFHARHALPFIHAGIPALIEKPVVASSGDASLLKKACSEYKTPVATGYCLRYLPSAQKMYQILKQKVVGSVFHVAISTGQYLPDWRTTKNYKDSVSAKKSLGGGVLLELSHEIDYSRWLFGDLQIKNAILRNSGTLEIDTEDLADVVALTGDNAVINIHLDFLQRQAHRKCVITGTEGRLEWDLIGNVITLYKESGTEILYKDAEFNKNNMYLEMLKDFIRLTEGKPNNCISLSDAIDTVTLIEQIKRVAV